MIEVEEEEIIKKEADDRGRINLGVKNAHKTITLAILDKEEDKED